MLVSSYKSSVLSVVNKCLLPVVILTMTACASALNNNSTVLSDGTFYTESFPEVSENTLAINASQDLFRVGDIADITFYNVESLSNSYVVNRDGTINFPLIGTQKVAGLTTLDLQQNLIAAYGENYLQNPSINVKLEAKALGNIVVDGAVSKPGVFELFKPVRLSEAVALAGGLNDVANSKEVYVVREIEGRRRIKVVNLKDIRQMGASDPKIYPQDIVYIQESSSKTAYNEFLKTVPILSTLLIVSTRP